MSFGMNVEQKFYNDFIIHEPELLIVFGNLGGCSYKNGVHFITTNWRFKVNIYSCSSIFTRKFSNIE